MKSRGVQRFQGVTADDRSTGWPLLSDLNLKFELDVLYLFSYLKFVSDALYFMYFMYIESDYYYCSFLIELRTCVPKQSKKSESAFLSVHHIFFSIQL